MRKDENINIRMEPGLKARADDVAKMCGTSTSMLIRLLLERFVENAENHDGRVVMPPEFRSYRIESKDKD
jgi:predicted DNA-binding protein